MFSKIKPVFVIIFWILLWLAISLLANNSIILPSPVEVIETALSSITTYNFWLTVFGSVIRIITGFILSCLIGTVLSVICNKAKIVEELTSPVMQFTKSAPIVCFIVILLVWFGIELLDFITVLIAVVPIFYFAVNEALKNRDKKIVDMLHVYNVSKKTIWRVFEWPGIRPYFNQASKTGIGVAWKSAVTAQMIGIVANTIGEKVYLSKITLDSSNLIMWMIIVVILGWACEKLISLIIKKLTNFWKTTVKPDTEISEKIDKEMHNDYLLKVENITKRFGKKEIFGGFNLKMKYGQKIALTWNTGEGKSTLLNIIMGLDKPTSGNITVNKYNPRTFSCVFQDCTLLNNLNVEQNIIVAANKTGKSFIGNHGLNIYELSGGMKRCVEIERAITADSKIVILDEPFTGLDESIKKLAIKYIKNNLNGRSLILVTHNKSDAEQLDCKIIDKNN